MIISSLQVKTCYASQNRPKYDKSVKPVHEMQNRVQLYETNKEGTFYLSNLVMSCPTPNEQHSGMTKLTRNGWEKKGRSDQLGTVACKYMRAYHPIQPSIGILALPMVESLQRIRAKLRYQLPMYVTAIEVGFMYMKNGIWVHEQEKDAYMLKGMISCPSWSLLPCLGWDRRPHVSDDSFNTTWL